MNRVRLLIIAGVVTVLIAAALPAFASFGGSPTVVSPDVHASPAPSRFADLDARAASIAEAVDQTVGVLSVLPPAGEGGPIEAAFRSKAARYDWQEIVFETVDGNLVYVSTQRLDPGSLGPLEAGIPAGGERQTWADGASAWVVAGRAFRGDTAYVPFVNVGFAAEGRYYGTVEYGAGIPSDLAGQAVATGATKPVTKGEAIAIAKAVEAALGASGFGR